MIEVVKVCLKHGDLTLNDVYKSKDSNLKLGYAFKCKECTYDKARNRPCKKHGEIKLEDRTSSGQCRLCCFEKNSFQELNRKRNSDRKTFNEKFRLKKEANPEWAKGIYKRMYDNQIALHGLDSINERQKASKFGLSIEKYRQMFIDQNDLCAICSQPETRIFKPRDKTKEMKVMKLCVDHNHATGKVRKLLCHDCNTMIGKAKEDIQILESAINYLKKHKE